MNNRCIAFSIVIGLILSLTGMAHGASYAELKPGRSDRNAVERPDVPLPPVAVRPTPSAPSALVMLQPRMADISSGQPSGEEAKREDIRCDGIKVCQEVLTGLPFRVLPRSFANIYRNPKTDQQNIVRANVRAFYPLFVYGLSGLDFSDPAAPKGWYQVGEEKSRAPLGWMQALDLLEWKQALVVSYTHPGIVGEERQRVLMFRDKHALEQLLDDPSYIDRTVDLYDRLAEGVVDPVLVSKEPERFVDITRDFYLLPIVDFETMDIEGDEVRLLRLAAAIPQKRGADTLADETFKREAMRKGAATNPERLREMGIDLVFVMDMTVSMQPYLDRTKQAVADIARKVSGTALRSHFQFGLVGFRDDIAKTPGLEFTSRNFTPDLVDMDQFVGVLDKEARAATISSVGYSEDLFAGVDTGLQSAWRDNALRFLVLVGDASAHPEGHEQNTTGKNEKVLRLAANDAQIHILSVQLKNPKHLDDQARARAQYGTLARVRGSESEEALIGVDVQDEKAYQGMVDRMAQSILDTLEQTQQGIVPEQSFNPEAMDSTANDPVAQTGQAMAKLTQVALVEYLGREVTPPKDILAWTLDRDLTNPAERSLDVRVLVSRRQLSDLITALKQVIEGVDRAQVTQQQFFEALQSVAGATMKAPDTIDGRATLARTGLLPSFIESLPYHSEVLSLNNEMYASMTAEQRSSLDSSLRAKLQQYYDINEQVDGWVKLNESDAEIDMVYPLHLDYLP